MILGTASKLTKKLNILPITFLKIRALILVSLANIAREPIAIEAPSSCLITLIRRCTSTIGVDPSASVKRTRSPSALSMPALTAAPLPILTGCFKHRQNFTDLQKLSTIPAVLSVLPSSTTITSMDIDEDSIKDRSSSKVAPSRCSSLYAGITTERSIINCRFPSLISVVRCYITSELNDSPTI